MIPEGYSLKKFLCLLLCALMILSLSACGKKDATDTDAQQEGSFAPETTAVIGSGLAQAIASVEDSDAETASDDGAGEMEPVVQDEPIAQDVALDVPADTAADVSAVAEATLTPEPTSNSAAAASDPQPFSTATPQPNTAISGYTEVVGTGLGFRFSYPQGWQNIPGKYSVCFVQPLENGTVYPARVCVTMKRISHSGNETRLQEQMVAFMETLMDQYDESPFEVDTELDTSTNFMGGKRSYATTYLAYDGEQEIKGYVAMTYFDKYVFCFHFQCAYEDYNVFEPAIRHLRDSVTPDEDSLNA